MLLRVAFEGMVDGELRKFKLEADRVAIAVQDSDVLLSAVADIVAALLAGKKVERRGATVTVDDKVLALPRGSTPDESHWQPWDE